MTWCLTFCLFGSFRIETPQGEVCTPRSSKAQALLALLLTEKNFERSRIWLQDKLWSDRGREQGAASLRQALTEIRKSLGDYSIALTTTRKTVGLNKDRVSLSKLEDDTAEFLEGIDVRDQEFEDWLRKERSKTSQPSARALSKPSQTRMVILDPDTDGNDMERLFAEIFVSGVASSLNEQLCIDVGSKSDHVNNRNRMSLRARAVCTNGAVVLHACCFDEQSNKNLWTGTRALPARGAPPIDHDDLLQLRNEAIDVVNEAICLDATRNNALQDASVISSTALNKLFSMDETEQQEADALLVHAFDINPRAVFLGWRIFLRTVQIVERHRVDVQRLKDEVEFLATKALEMEPMNAMVIAQVAHSEMLVSGNPAKGYELARRAVALNPSNPFAQFVLSSAEMLVGQPKQAHETMIRARHLGKRSPYRFWWDAAVCLTATATGHLDVAKELAQASHSLSPCFRPPLRYLAALLIQNDEFDNAQIVIDRLKELEPGFVVEQLTQDTNYPTATLRMANVVDTAKLRDLS